MKYSTQRRQKRNMKYMRQTESKQQRADLNSTTSLIKLNVNGLNTLTKGQMFWGQAVIKKLDSTICYLQHFKYKNTNRLKVKG